METKRLDYLDMAKGVGIIMVTYGHITQLGNPVDAWMSLFKITVFFIVAGYLMAMKKPQDKSSIGQYTKKLAKSLMWPYLTFSIIFIGATFFRQFINQADYSETIHTYLYATATLRGISTLWFLPCIFFAQALFFMILKSRQKWLMAIMLVVPIVVGLYAQNYILGLEDTASEHDLILYSYPVITVAKAIIAIWFVLLGYLGYFVVTKYVNTTAKQIAAGIILSGATIAMSLNSHGIDYNCMHLGDNPVYFFAGGVIGSFGALLLFQGLGRWWKSDLLVYFGKNSLILMTIQRSLFLIHIVEKGFAEHFTIHEVVCTRYYIETLCVLAFVLILAAGFIELINRKCPKLMKL